MTFEGGSQDPMDEIRATAERFGSLAEDEHALQAASQRVAHARVLIGTAATDRELLLAKEAFLSALVDKFNVFTARTLFALELRQL